MKILFPIFGIHKIQLFHVYIDECACRTKTSNLSYGCDSPVGYSRKLPKKLLFLRSEEHSSAIGIGDGPI